MNNAEYEINALINNIDHELTNLKTAHNRPLGALNFFTDNIQFTVQLDLQYGSYYKEFKVIVVIATPIITPPILQPAWDTPAGFYFINLDGMDISNDYTTYTYEMSLSSDTLTSANIKFSALSSQPVESINWEYI